MSFVAPYRTVLSRRGVTSLLLFSILARVPLAAMTVVVTLHVVETLGRGYGAAGLVGAALTAGLAVGAPWRGRLVDRHGLRRALVPSLVGETVFWCTAPFVPYEALLAMAFVGGVFGLPIFSVVRQSLAVLVPPEGRRAAYALDSMAVELTFIVGPSAGVLIATGSTEAAMLAIGVSIFAAGVGLFLLNPPVRSPEDPRPVAAPEPAGAPGAVVPPAQGRSPGPWWRPSWFSAPMALLLAVTFGALLVLGGTDVAVVALLRHHGELGSAWLVFTAWSVASLLGGLVFGAVRRPVSPSLLLLVMGACTLPIGFAPSAAWLAVAIVPAGLLCAPVLSATAAAVSTLVPEEIRGEAMGWYGSAMTIGMALGAPLAGAAADLLGPWCGFAAAGAIGLAIGVVALATPWTPGPEPVPDAESERGEPVPVG